MSFNNITRHGSRQRISLVEVEERIGRVKWNLPMVLVQAPGNSFNLVSAGDIAAKNSVPEIPISAVDGYALRSSDTLGITARSPGRFKLAGISMANAGFHGRIGRNQCCEVYTGAPVPEDCDTIVMSEAVERSDDEVLISSCLEPGNNVRSPGEDLHAGVRIAEKGEVLDPFRISAAMASKIENIPVYEKLRASVISTGDELMPGSENFTVNSGQGLIVEYFSRPWINFSYGPICPDNAEKIREAVENLLDVNNILVITGGTAIGGKDMVPEAMKDAAETIFSGVQMRPGRTITLYRIKGKPVFSISGLPGPSLTSFETILEIFLKTAYGYRVGRKSVMATASESVKLVADSLNIKRIKFENGSDQLMFRVFRKSGLQALMESDGVVEAGPGIESIEKGKLYRIKLNR